MLFSVLPDTSTGAGVSVESSVITSVVSVRSVSAFVSLCPASGSVAVDAFSDSVHFTELSGRHSVLERPLSEVNGRLFFS